MTSSYTKKIVCLANSRKPPSGRCVAGREIIATGFGGWIRPISDRPTQEISLEERRYYDGRDPSVLDIISMEMKGPLPRQHQKENHLIDSDWCWAKQGKMGWHDIQSAVEDPGGPLWLNGHSSSNGLNDQVPEAGVDGLGRSLFLLHPEALKVVVASEGGKQGSRRRRVRTRFNLCGHSYCFVVTDPWLEEKLLAKPDREYSVKEALLCVSLGELFHGFAYKLTASVITPKRAGA